MELPSYNSSNIELRNAYCGGRKLFMNINDPKKKVATKRIETLQDNDLLFLEDEKHMFRNLSDAETKLSHRRYQYTKRFSLEGADSFLYWLC